MLVADGVPHPVMVGGVPHPVKVPPGTPPPFRPGWGYPRYPPPSRPGMGYPPPSDLGWGTPPPSDLGWGTPHHQTWDGVSPPLMVNRQTFPSINITFPCTTYAGGNNAFRDSATIQCSFKTHFFIFAPYQIRVGY